jgi:phosphoribosylanthranilate isomerase
MSNDTQYALRKRPVPMFQTKICGITNVDDARAAAQAGADALGMNFYPRSKRHISAELARDIIAAIPAGIIKVGLFVNSPAGDICRLFDELGLNLIQLHGNEPPDFLPQLGHRPVMRAFRLGPEGLPPVVQYLDQCRELNALPTLTLLDSAVQGSYGGTGRTLDWTLAREYLLLPNLPPLVLAGGLTPRNVAEAIRTVRPAAVDVASGVESQPGRKDQAMVAQFVLAARAARTGKADTLI